MNKLTSNSIQIKLILTLDNISVVIGRISVWQGLESRGERDYLHCCLSVIMNVLTSAPPSFSVKKMANNF